MPPGRGPLPLSPQLTTDEAYAKAFGDAAAAAASARAALPGLFGLIQSSAAKRGWATPCWGGGGDSSGGARGGDRREGGSLRRS